MRKIDWVYMLVLVALMGGMAFGLQEAAEPAAAEPAVAADDASDAGEESQVPLWTGILGGVIGGLGAAILGWIKNRKTDTGEMEKFEIKYAWPTFVIGAGVGVASHFMGKSPHDLITALEVSPMYGGIIFVVEAGIKAVWRNSVPMLRDWLATVKTGAAK